MNTLDICSIVICSPFTTSLYVNMYLIPLFYCSSSVLKSSLPEWVTYQEVYETSAGKMYMRGVTGIDPAWLPIFCPSQCVLSQPMTEPEPYWNDKTGQVMCHVTGTFGKQAWNLPKVEVVHPKSNPKYRYVKRRVW